MLRRLLVDSTLYTIATAIRGLVGLLMLPIYTRFLAAADYGLIDLVTLTNSVLVIVATLEVSQGMARLLPEAANADERRRLSSTTFWFTAATMLGVGTIVLLAAPALAPLLLQKADAAGLLRLGIGAALVSALQAVALRHLRSSLRPRSYLAVTTLTIVTTALVTVFLLSQFQLGPAALLIGHGAGSAAGLALAWRFSGSELAWTWDADALRKMLNYSYPLIAASLGVIAASQASRWIIAHQGSLDATGLFGIAARVAAVVGLAASGLQHSLGPLIYASHRNAQTPASLALSFSLFVACGLTLCTALTLFAPEILHVLAAPQFHAAAPLIGPVSAAILITSTTMFAPGLEIALKTGWLAAVSLLSGALNLFLCWFAVSSWGAIGAAAAMCLSAIVHVILIFRFSQRHYPVPHRWGRILAAIVLAMMISQSGRATTTIGLNLEHWSARMLLLAGLAFTCGYLLLRRPTRTA